MRVLAGWHTARALPAASHLILFALIIAVPLLLLVGILLYRSVALERQQLERRIVQVLEDVVASVDRDMDRHLTVLQTLATSPDLANGDWRGIYDQAKAGLPEQEGLVLTDAEGRQLINTFAPLGQPPRMTGDPATLQEIRQTKRTVVSDLFVGLATKQPVYNISMPIIYGGKVRYVMSLALLPDNLKTLLEGHSLSPGWTTTIWDRKGVILARSRDHGRLVGSSVPPAWLAQGRNTLFRTTSVDGEPVMAVVGAARLSEWGIGVTFPASLIESQVRNSLLFWGATIVLAVALAVTLALVLGRQLTRPLAAATAAAAALGRGQPFTVRDSRLKEANAVNQALRDAQRDLERSSAALRESEEQLRAAAEAAQFGAHQYDALTDRSLRSPPLLRILGVDEATPSFEAALVAVHPDDREQVRLRKQQILRTEGVYQLAYRIRRPDGQVRWVMDRGQVIRDGEGKALKVVGVLLDITDLKAAEQRQRLLFDELNHRVKNTLAIVQSLAQQTLRARPEPAAFAESFGHRLASLARAHDLLTRESWNGAPLYKIVVTALEPFLGTNGRIHVDGPAVQIPAGSTITLSLMLHELATNAAKYGALSRDDGRVSIGWTAATAGDAVTVDLWWREEDGPPVVASRHKGFGSRLLAASALQLNAELDIDFAADGLKLRLRFALPVASPPGGEAG